jgi:protein SCO1/2
MNTFAKIALSLSLLTLLPACATESQTTPPVQSSKAANSIHEFALEDHLGNPFSKTHLANKWSLIFLGYTSCPDVCPTTMMELNFAYPELQSMAKEPVQVILLSADPTRDTKERLENYIKYFNKDFVALRGEHEQLKPFTQNLGLVYKVNTPKTPDEFYLVDHSAAVVLVNPNVEIQAFFKPKVNEQGILAVDTDEVIENFSIITQFYSQ